MDCAAQHCPRPAPIPAPIISSPRNCQVAHGGVACVAHIEYAVEAVAVDDGLVLPSTTYHDCAENV